MGEEGEKDLVAIEGIKVRGWLLESREQREGGREGEGTGGEGRNR